MQLVCRLTLDTLALTARYQADRHVTSAVRVGQCRATCVLKGPFGNLRNIFNGRTLHFSRKIYFILNDQMSGIIINLLLVNINFAIN